MMTVKKKLRIKQRNPPLMVTPTNENFAVPIPFPMRGKGGKGGRVFAAYYTIHNSSYFVVTGVWKEEANRLKTRVL